MAEKPKRFTETYDIAIPSVGVSMDPSGFDELINTNGVVFIHHKAILCPLNVVDRMDIRSSHLDCKCSNGHLYERAGEVTAFFSGNSTNSVFENAGIVDGSTIQVTLPRRYDDKDVPVICAEYDRFYLRDHVGFASHQQRFEASQTGLERLEFPAEFVEFLMDARGESYRQDIDFVLDRGFVKWTTDRRPGFDPVAGKGVVCSIRYHFQPHWYCQRIMHEIRVIRDVDIITGEVTTARMPFAVLLQRETVFRDKARTSATDNDPRAGAGPQTGGFGPR